MCSCNVQWILIWTLSGDVENSRNQGGSEQAHTYTTRVETLEGSGWWHRKILNFLPEAQWIYIYTRNNSYGKRPENWINRVSTINGKRTALRQVEEAETQTLDKLYIQCGKTLAGGSPQLQTSLWGARSSSPTSGNPNLRTCTGNMNLQKSGFFFFIA